MQFYYIYQCTSIKIKLELKKNILNFGYGVTYKDEGMLLHSFDRFFGKKNLYYHLSAIWTSVNYIMTTRALI